MTVEVTVHEAKTHLSKLLARVEAGEEIVIKRGSKPIARLSALAPRLPRTLGGDEGLFAIPADFDELPEDVLDEFEPSNGGLFPGALRQ
jgi:prevent-host-death family protein